MSDIIPAAFFIGLSITGLAVQIYLATNVLERIAAALEKGPRS